MDSSNCQTSHTHPTIEMDKAHITLVVVVINQQKPIILASLSVGMGPKSILRIVHHPADEEPEEFPKKV